MKNQEESIRTLANGAIVWELKFETGIQRVDLEHKIFLELINTLSVMLDRHVEQMMLDRLVEEIQKYAEFHFLSEENFMQQINYPDYKAHRDLHFELLERFNVAKHKNDKLRDFLDFMYDWFIGHTIKVDMQIKDYMQAEDIDVDYSLHLYPPPAK